MLSVSELNEQAKALLETHFEYVEVVGEISRLTKHGSGHWYFALKDERAAISCVMYRMSNAKLKFDVKDGMKVQIYGKISLYTPSGSYQLIASSMRPDGEGELELAFKQLQEKLSKEGLFDASCKKQLMRMPRKVALVTSATSAALQDMLKVANSRWKLTEIFIFDALTQGQNAPTSLISALKKADGYGVDVIILARGGGSREDLWCFNDEGLARAIFDAKTPVISAIGHEIDYVISDFVADFRAPTPTAAMMQILPDENEILQYLDAVEKSLDTVMLQKISKLENRLNFIMAKLSTNALKVKIDLKIAQILASSQKLDMLLRGKILKLESKINELNATYKARQSFFESTKGLIQVRLNNTNAILEELQAGDEVELVGQNAIKKAKIL
ncbi:exodeoxyribonuclease VII large subunit [Campylobacter sp. RM9344]|uniref:Exodeoxyribonuclease 7 large subunit n=1 Tax=Campylobacter californiensis TaxID=1032243 RepID=A0AAW3ZVX4_9BACT|nr:MULTISPECIES: exodeoxyribonuclease VII large subunit [unclassified Campylobacter]MBE2984163.1 exodeoxyribonuclease VII large subunit [Campylobacter sp. RM6883]MBE2995532.1 exodeoxyribonuclease VII large subunit [Campylobacter sp. RM6913]MBE3029799.1 exodeoxyribonuclease VII large subunit [Campylobacter sp. RM9344]MBE3607784.1 exodeoxyribonuclease VII large subunit [Campylobacter sp. RM9337]QCD51392.1 exodeoxyribonuclease VII, large subunit [Campylobacter sp. RM6914]